MRYKRAAAVPQRLSRLAGSAPIQTCYLHTSERPLNEDETMMMSLICLLTLAKKLSLAAHRRVAGCAISCIWGPSVGGAAAMREGRDVRVSCHLQCRAVNYGLMRSPTPPSGLAAFKSTSRLVLFFDVG